MVDLAAINRIREMLGRPLLEFAIPGINDPGDHYREWEHPRDKNGQWIEKFGHVDLGGGLAGVVESLNNDGTVTARVTSAPNAPDKVGTRVTAAPDQIEAIDAKARLGDAKAQKAFPEPPTDGDESKIRAFESGVTKDPTGAERVFRPMTAQERSQHKVPNNWRDVQFNESWDQGDKTISDDLYDGLIAVGTDQQGNTQYWYDDRAKVIRDNKKWSEDGSATKTLEHLDEISDVIRRDMHDNDAAAALGMQLLLGLRIGGKTSKVKKDPNQVAYGASSLQARHISFDGDKTILDFDAKKGVHIHLETADPTVRELMQERLKTRSGNDPIFNTTAPAVRTYFGGVQKEIGVDGLHPHNLRHAFATTLAKNLIANYPAPRSAAEAATVKKAVAKQVAAALGNNPNEAIKSYIDPKVWDLLKVTK